MLFAVIFCCVNTPNTQMDKGLRESQNNSAAFCRISAIFWVGKPCRVESLRRRSGLCKRAGFFLIFRGIPDPKNKTPVSCRKAGKRPNPYKN